MSQTALLSRCKGIIFPILIAFCCAVFWLFAAMLAAIPAKMITGHADTIANEYLNTWVVCFVPLLLVIDILIALLVGDHTIRRNFFNRLGGAITLGATTVYGIGVIVHKLSSAVPPDPGALPPLVVSPVAIYLVACTCLVVIRTISYVNVGVVIPIDSRGQRRGRASGSPRQA